MLISFLKIISFCLLENFQNQGMIYSAKKKVMTAVDFLCHGIADCFCHTENIWAQFRQSALCVFPSPNLLDTAEE